MTPYDKRDFDVAEVRRLRCCDAGRGAPSYSSALHGTGT